MAASKRVSFISVRTISLFGDGQALTVFKDLERNIPRWVPTSHHLDDPAQCGSMGISLLYRPQYWCRECDGGISFRRGTSGRGRFGVRSVSLSHGWR